MIKDLAIMAAITLALIFFNKCTECKCLLNENAKLKNDVSFYKKSAEQYSSFVSQLTDMYLDAKEDVMFAKVPKGTVEAVKYAMKYAHPDNGGNAEDFIRFKKCYEELARK